MNFNKTLQNLFWQMVKFGIDRVLMPCFSGPDNSNPLTSKQKQSKQFQVFTVFILKFAPHFNKVISVYAI